MRLIYVLLANVAIFGCVDAFKILVYSPKIGHSHSNFMGRIADTLVAAGHNVTTLIPCGTQSIADGTTKSNVVHVVPDAETTALFDSVLNGDDFDPFLESNFNPIGSFVQGKVFGEIFAKLCRATVNQNEILDRLRADAFDIMIAEPFDVCGIGMAPYIAPKSLALVSSSVLLPVMYNYLGVPKAVSYSPTFPVSSLDPHSMIDRAWNYAGQVVSSFAFPEGAIEAVLRERFGPDHPSIASIASQAAIAFTNGEPLLNVAAPTLHKIVDIAGLGAKEPKALDKKWLDILALRPRTVLISFGSIAKSYMLKPEAKSAILKTVAHYPDVTFIWKYEKLEDDFALKEAAKLPNLVLSNWMPQNDLLNHPNLAAFMTHGGMGSVQETARRGVPAILLPLFGDQPRNALMMQKQGLGKILEKWNIGDSAKIIAALGEILSDESYQTRATEMARKLAGKPFSAQELLVKNIEFAAEFGASDSLRPASIEMSLVELYNLDLALIAFVVVAAAAMLFLRVVQAIVLRVIVKKKLE